MKQALTTNKGTSRTKKGCYYSAKLWIKILTDSIAQVGNKQLTKKF